MLKHLASIAVFLAMALPIPSAWADDYQDTVSIFKNAGDSGTFFDKAYGYAVCPTIGKAGAVIGGAHGTGRVYANGKHVGDTSMSQLTVGVQLGGTAYSQIVFFEDERAFKDFTSGKFEFGALGGAEDALESVVVLGGNRIELVVVALGAGAG